MTRVLVVDDEAQLLRALITNLRARGYDVDGATTGEIALEMAARHHPDVVVLDLGLPSLSGIEVIHGLRGWTEVPIIVLSARQDEFDKVAALGLGADDYITKPFALAELLARVAAVLRRARLSDPARIPNNGASSPEAPAPAPPEKLLRFGDVVVDLAERTVSRAGCAVKLTHLEFELLSFLCSNSGRVHSREELLRQVWGFQQGQARTVDNFVAQLRAKLERDPDQPRHLLTVRGSGYRFSAA